MKGREREREVCLVKKGVREREREREREEEREKKRERRREGEMTKAEKKSAQTNRIAPISLQRMDSVRVYHMFLIYLD